MGVSMALVLASNITINLDLGAAYGTAKAGTGISSISIWRPGLVMKSLIPVVMAGILGIYGMIVAVIISQKGTEIFYLVKNSNDYSQRLGFMHMASGLVCGFSCIVYNDGYRRLDIRLERWETWVFVVMRCSRDYSSV